MFSLVTTTLNEIDSLDGFIKGIESQTMLPEEVVIVDGGSKDGTLQRLRDWCIVSKLSIRIIELSSCNVAKGRNHAIRSATFDIIVSTDFGCAFHENWLAELVTPFNRQEVDVVGGAYTVLEGELLSLSARANYILTDGYQLNLDDQFIPSSRSIAYRKSVWEDVGGYDEWLTLAADDLVFGLKIRSRGYKIILKENPYVYWKRHSKGKKYLKEAYNYGRGDGEAGVNLRNTVSIVVETTARWLLYSLLIVNVFVRLSYSGGIVFSVPLLIGFRPHHKAYRNWLKHRSRKYNLKVLLASWLLIELSRLNYLWGYLKGYFLSTHHIRLQRRILHKTYL